jgi:hypothetical protein
MKEVGRRRDEVCSGGGTHGQKVGTAQNAKISEMERVCVSDASDVAVKLSLWLTHLFLDLSVLLHFFWRAGCFVLLGECVVLRPQRFHNTRTSLCTFPRIPSAPPPLLPFHIAFLTRFDSLDITVLGGQGVE